MILSILLVFTGGRNSSNAAFSESKTGNDNQFLVDFDILNSTITNQIPLIEGDEVETTINIKKGSADITVENENGAIAFQGNNVENSKFIIRINETGIYTISITGYKAEGNVYFKKLIK